MGIDFKALADMMIDDYCDVYGVDQAILMLLGTGLTQDDLVNELGFSREDVGDAINEN